jgi:signal transduction histidine kinase
VTELSAIAPAVSSPEIPAPENPEIEGTTTYSRSEFVAEVRTERLSLLWKATLAFAFVVIWVIVVITQGVGDSAASIITAVSTILVSSLLTSQLLKVERYEWATYSYILGLIMTVSIMMIFDNEDTRTLVPFLGILIIFIAGTLMSVQALFTMLAVAFIAMLGIPFVATGDFVTNAGVGFAFVLMALTALISAQTSGELYGIAEWALDSYRKERETAVKLHESRVAVEKSLLKQQSLTMQLRHLNADLDKAREAAEIAKQFRGQFLANMSHELRTPLNAVIGFSDTMLNFPLMYEGVELPPEYRKDMTQIYTSGKHLLSIINDILDLSKIDAGRLEVEIQPVDLEPIFKGVLSTAVGLVGGKPVKLHRNTPDPLPMVTADPIRFRQVLLNLYSNAAKFTDEGSITLSLQSESNRVIIAVTDTGSGIPKQQQEMVFEAFQQGESGRKQQRQGAGLGLAISRQLLNLMDGTIWVESEPGRGSTFYVALPRHYPPGSDAEWVEVEATHTEPAQ